MAAIIPELERAVNEALRAGVPDDAIVLDPGIGFSKRSEHSVRALAQLPRLVKVGFPVMVGASRKRFIGEITGVKKAAERDAGTVGAHVVALTLGASWFRVHDVRVHREALDVAAALVRDAGFDPVIVGPLARGKEFEPDTPPYNTGMAGPELRALFGRRP
jgi:dihydropteroate synthase